ncbi:MAG: HPr family phosphocarrier protein [Anaerostipes sp.]|nr:HPr family phosphocarrier protein [Anaerostipes sp.]
MLLRKKVTVRNSSGIHIRTAAELANLCEKIPGEVKVLWMGHIYDGKSIMELLDARIRKGDEITIEVTGGEEEKAVRKIEECILHWK